MHRRANDTGSITEQILDDNKTRISEAWRAESARRAGMVCGELAEIQSLREQLRVALACRAA